MKEPFGTTNVDLQKAIIEVKKLLPSIEQRLNHYDKNISTLIDAIQHVDNKLDDIDLRMQDITLEIKNYEKQTDVSLIKVNNELENLQKHVNFLEKEFMQEKERIHETREIAFGLKTRFTLFLILSFVFGFFLETLITKTKFISALLKFL